MFGKSQDGGTLKASLESAAGIGGFLLYAEAIGVIEGPGCITPF